MNLTLHESQINLFIYFQKLLLKKKRNIENISVNIILY